MIIKETPENMTKSGIYAIENINNGYFYIGSTESFIKRQKQHVSMLTKSNHSNIYLQNAWNSQSENEFVFKILEFVDDPLLMPNKEYEYIKQFKNVYNINDPRDEYIKGRIVLETVEKVPTRKDDGYRYTRNGVLNWLSYKYRDKMIKLHENIDERKFYNKEALDKWFINDLEGHDVLNDDRIEGLLNEWYKIEGFSIVRTGIYKKTIEKLFNKKCPRNALILTLSDVPRKLHAMQYNKNFFMRTPKKPRCMIDSNYIMEIKNPDQLTISPNSTMYDVNLIAANYEKLLLELKSKIEIHKYIDKDKIDNFFIKKIKKDGLSKNVKMSKIQKILTRVYSKFDLSVINTAYYSEELQKLVRHDNEDAIIISKDTKSIITEDYAKYIRSNKTNNE
ncbi:GIY-YIG nuclease family protein [Priestia flexa]|uniref:GIY-YIG nuclease family protein n=1 Tax=Priestia flexa TaxID=86664 RepID=UPI000473C737|nr:GIY-YIG nuclease family protein [Priestia flexa]